MTWAGVTPVLTGRVEAAASTGAGEAKAAAEKTRGERRTLVARIRRMDNLLGVDSDHHDYETNLIQMSNIFCLCFYFNNLRERFHAFLIMQSKNAPEAEQDSQSAAHKRRTPRNGWHEQPCVEAISRMKVVILAQAGGRMRQLPVAELSYSCRRCAQYAHRRRSGARGASVPAGNQNLVPLL